MSETVQKKNTAIERIIAKIDNDFNPDNSDWIPRVGAWCIDAMSQLNILRTKKKRVKLKVIDRIAYSNCDLDSELTVYDKNGCKLKEASTSCTSCSQDSSTGGGEQVDTASATDTVSIVNTGKKQAPNYVIAETINDKYPPRYNVNHYILGDKSRYQERNYVVVDSNKIELNYDTDCIIVETNAVETNISSIYGCELPVIPNNGTLIEALVNFCMYKMLTRGYKHPVMNLAASQYGTNPYYLWVQGKEEARRSVLNDTDADDASDLFRSNFVIDTFDGRHA